jgi:hypothetical protein
MPANPTEKNIKKCAALYQEGMKAMGLSEQKEKTARYIARLREMYASPQFKEHNVYPTMDVTSIYTVIAMCLELRSFGLSNEEIMAFTDAAFKKRRAFFDGLIKLINLLPNSFQIAKKWNVGDHAKRVKDHSITYDYFDVTDDSITYSISKCMYVEMFATYGIRELCKIYCNTDTRSYNGLTRHVRFIRHSDLSDGPCCRDEVHRRCQNVSKD